MATSHDDMVQLTNAAGAVTRDYRYDAFGVEQNPDDTDANPWRYCGEYFDLSSGTYYLRDRYYDPTAARFAPEDPARAGLNWYTYAGNNPIMFIDTWGLDYIIAWSYSGSRDILPFERDYLNKNGFNVTADGDTSDWDDAMWTEFDKRSAFSRAAQTRKANLMKMGIPESDIILQRIDGKDDLSDKWSEWENIDIVEGLDFYSHGYSGGAEVYGGSGGFWDNAGQLNWTSTLRQLTINGKNVGYISTPYAKFYGCNTANGEFAQNFANSQGVTTYAQTNYTSFSTGTGWFSGINPHGTSLNVYMNVYNKIVIFGKRIVKTSIVPMKRFDPVK